MGLQLVERLLPALEKMNWPQTTAVTPQGREAYLIGLDKLDDYKGDPKELAAALRIFMSGNSLPFAYAGAAYTLITAARESDGTYAEAGLEAAMDYLEKAQALEPEYVDINFIEAMVYVLNGRYDDARTVLDYLHAQEPTNFFVHQVEVLYWQKQGDVDQATLWINRASDQAINVPQKLKLRQQLGDVYMAAGRLDEAREVYKEAVKLDSQNVMLWHKLSLIYWQQENYEEAARHNKEALKLQDFPAARKLEAALSEKLDDPGVLGRLFGRG